ncbi:MAG: DinB family protein [Bryobacteraceae bacterium]|nr:DinB family protein [Bryobacteraceae bacterium]
MRYEQHHFANRSVRYVTIALILAAFATPVFAQSDFKSAVLKHLKTSRDFTLKVADQMAEADYAFKLTPPQMSFAEQIVHLTQELDEYIAPFSGGKPNPAKPVTMNKKDVMAFVQKSFDDVMAKVSKLTPAQLSKTYASEEGMMSGTELLMGMLDHTTHHRASAEMYLRAKGITPVEYQF